MGELEAMDARGPSPVERSLFPGREPGRSKPGGVVVITRFKCRSRRQMLVIVRLHRRLKKKVSAASDGFIGVRLYPQWNERVLLSVSLWRDLTSLYDMGSVPEHVAATRIPGRLGINTSCGVFEYSGDWRVILFGEGWSTTSPLD